MATRTRSYKLQSKEATCQSTNDRTIGIADLIEYYMSLGQGDNNKIVAGQMNYQLFKMVGYKEQKKTGANFDVPMQTLIDEIDEWRNQKFISEEEASEQKNALYAMQSKHVVKEVLFNRGQFEMVYGLTGFIRLNGKYAS
uniref:Uncharacterized protein n=1 Tax=Romanomermis culicivorax TaxID=13658 RepID=A0A915JTH0_ROMCU